MALQLRLTDHEGDTRWRWTLQDDRGNFLADHEVRLEPGGWVQRPRDPGQLEWRGSGRTHLEMPDGG